jgi:Protein of unknown function (DUF551)
MTLSEWMPIDTAPTDGTPVLLYCQDIKGSWKRNKRMPKNVVIGLCDAEDYRDNPIWLGDVGEVDDGYESTGTCFEYEQLYPSHWMPLPEEPK